MHRFFNLFINSSKVFKYTSLVVSVSLFITAQANAVGFLAQFERDANDVGGNEVAYLTYNSFADVLSNTIASNVFSALDVASTFTSTGLAFDGNQGGGGNNGGGGGNNIVPEPITATLGLMGLGVLGMASRRRTV